MRNDSVNLRYSVRTHTLSFCRNLLALLLFICRVFVNSPNLAALTELLLLIAAPLKSEHGAESILPQWTHVAVPSFGH